MPRLSEMPVPDLPLTGLELMPVLQGAGLPGNRGVPLFAHASLPRGAVLALRRPMLADLSATSDADPGAGNVRWDDADPDDASELYISDDDADSGDLSAAFSALANGGFLYVQGAPTGDRGNWQKWQVTAVSTESGYTKLQVTLQASDGAFTDDDEIELSFQQPNPPLGVDRGVTTAVSSSSGTTTLDASLGDYFTTVLSENTTLAVTNVPQACTISLRITQDATTARTVTFPASFLKRGGGDFAIPASLGARHRLVATTDDYGASWDVELGEGYE